MAEIRRSRIDTLKTRASRTLYFLMGAAVGAAGVWAAVNVSDSAADTLNLVPESDLSTAQLVIGDLEGRLDDASTALQRALGSELAQEALNKVGIELLREALDRLVPGTGD